KILRARRRGAGEGGADFVADDVDAVAGDMPACAGDLSRNIIGEILAAGAKANLRRLKAAVDQQIYRKQRPTLQDFNLRSHFFTSPLRRMGAAISCGNRNGQVCAWQGKSATEAVTGRHLIRHNLESRAATELAPPARLQDTGL